MKLHVWNFACDFLKRYASHPCLFIENVFFFFGKMLKSAKNCEKWRFLQITLHTATEQRYFMHQKSFKFSKYHSLICFLSENKLFATNGFSNSVKNADQTQVLTNQLLSDARSRTPVLQYWFVNVLSYQNICTCWWSRKYCKVFSLGQSQYAYGFSNFCIMLATCMK